MKKANSATETGVGKKFSSIGDYHRSFPLEVRKLMELLHTAIQEAAPNAIETISYNMPTFKLNKNLVHYAACKEHIGFYPTPSPIQVFAKELKGYKTSKGAIQFPLIQPIPFDLVKKIVKFRVGEDLQDKKSSPSKTPKPK